MDIARVAVATALLTSLAAAASAQAPRQGDRQFMDEATTSSVAEITAGQAAQAQGSPGVRVFGRWMAADHTFLKVLIGDRAKEMGVALPGATVQTETGGPSFAGKHDAEFDQAYLPGQIADHQKAIALFEHEAAEGEDPTLKHLAQVTLPLLREHLAVAQELSGAKPAQ